MTIKYFKTLASDLPPSNTSIICTGEKFCFTQNCQASYTVFMPYIKIYIYIYVNQQKWIICLMALCILIY